MAFIVLERASLDKEKTTTLPMLSADHPFFVDVEGGICFCYWMLVLTGLFAVVKLHYYSTRKQ